MCLILIILLVVFYTASLCTLIAVTLERFWSICYPISHRKHNTKRITQAILVSQWTLPVLSGIWTYFEHEYCRNIDEECKCTVAVTITTRMKRIYSFFVITSFFLMIAVYAFILWKISKMVQCQHLNFIHN